MRRMVILKTTLLEFLMDEIYSPELIDVGFELKDCVSDYLNGYLQRKSKAKVALSSEDEVIRSFAETDFDKASKGYDQAVKILKAISVIRQAKFDELQTGEKNK